MSSIDVTGLPVDVALRKVQSHFRLPVRYDGDGDGWMDNDFDSDVTNTVIF